MIKQVARASPLGSVLSSEQVRLQCSGSYCEGAPDAVRSRPRICRVSGRDCGGSGSVHMLDGSRQVRSGL